MIEETRERERLESHLGKLRGNRGKRLLDSQSTKAVTHAIKETVEELDGIDDAAREFERREQAETAKQRAIDRGVAEVQLLSVRKEIHAATKLANASAVELCAQLRLIFELFEVARTKAVVLGDPIPTPWTQFEVISRVGWRLARLLSGINARCRNRIGGVQFSLHGIHPENEDWAARESKLLNLENELETKE